jgi:leader peptidase (prepilin peptidase)/N-methyltransferase
MKMPSIRLPYFVFCRAFFAGAGVFFVVSCFTPAVFVAAVSFFAFAAALMVITFIDLDHRVIPDVISLPGIGIGFLLSFFQPSVSVLESLIGLVIGGGSLFLVAWAYQAIAKREGMGGGDVKLLAMIGARSAGMAFNRLVDLPYDTRNPRTADIRPVPGMPET